jgi:hypothetical protein
VIPQLAQPSKPLLIAPKNLIDAIDDAAERLAQAWLDRSNSNLPEHDARHFQERQDIVKCQRRLNIGDGILDGLCCTHDFPLFATLSRCAPLAANGMSASIVAVALSGGMPQEQLVTPTPQTRPTFRRPGYLGD